MERAQGHEDILALLSKHDGGSIHGQQVAHVELADKLNTYLVPIHVEIHAGKVHLHNVGFEIGHSAHGIRLYRSLCVLYHVQAVFVIGVCDDESRFWQHVKERFFCVSIVLERLVIV